MMVSICLPNRWLVRPHPLKTPMATVSQTMQRSWLAPIHLVAVPWRQVWWDLWFCRVKPRALTSKAWRHRVSHGSLTLPLVPMDLPSSMCRNSALSLFLARSTSLAMRSMSPPILLWISQRWHPGAEACISSM